MSTSGGAAALTAAQQNRPGNSQVVGSTVQPCPLQQVHWIEIELLGEDGNGVADQAYRIVAPNGQEYLGRTDAFGRARVDRIPAGNCKISFTELDQEAWESA